MHYNLTPTESVAVVEDSPERFVVEVTYAPGGSKPPMHFHPAQDEHFEITRGSIDVRLGRNPPIRLDAGDTLDIPRGTPHALWNAGAETAVATWITTPPGRTHAWFRTLSAAGTRSPLKLAPLLVAYDDVFRLAGPQWLIRPALRLVTLVSRRLRPVPQAAHFGQRD
jgi:quercetin dioxygenase-like cupin family protein